MGLREYRRKRDFGKTPELEGRVAERHGPRRFVIQKHAASHLHYDFRLELEGVLKSWAVPKGPSLDPTVKRLAMLTEDHPLDYAGFEGVIPEGQYGGGTVLLWDEGEWIPIGNPHQGFHAGALRFTLRGHKLRGEWMLARTRGQDRRDSASSWILTKASDAEARAEAELRITEARPESVTTGRTLEAIARERDRVWQSNRGEAARGPAPVLEPPPLQRARPANAVPRGDAWLHEVRFHGLRLLATKDARGVRLVDECGADRARDLPRIAAAIAALSPPQLTVDGVAAVLAPDGTTDRALLDAALARKRDTDVVFYAFDLVRRRGRSLASRALEARKEALEATLTEGRGGTAGPLRFSAHVIGSGEAYLAKACELSLPAIVSKRRASRYEPGESEAWRIVPCPARASAGTRASRPLRGSAPGASRIASAPGDRASTRVTEVRGVRITHADRVVYPSLGMTKETLAQFYASIEPWIVPHLRGRPLTLVRCPDGAETPCAYMRHARVWGPPALRRVMVREKTKTGEYLVCDSIEAVVSLVQIGILEIHTWNAVADDLERPDRVVFDLDPDEALPFARVVAAAREVRERLQALELTSFVKTTGGKGLHVVVPLRPSLGWDDCFAFTRAVAEALVADSPRAYTTAMPKDRRKGKVLVDTLRNNRGNTSVAAYSTRARPDATVSVPIAWDELDAPLDPSVFTVETVPSRLAALASDPWRDAATPRQKLRRSMIRRLR